jgi:hypothetical protein
MAGGLAILRGVQKMEGPQMEADMEIGRLAAELFMLERPHLPWPARPKVDEETRRRRIAELRAVLEAVKERNERPTMH